MTDELLSEFAQDVKTWTLLPSSGGRFEFTINGKLAFSKKAEGRYPEISELKAMLEKAMKGHILGQAQLVGTYQKQR